MQVQVADAGMLQDNGPSVGFAIAGGAQTLVMSTAYKYVSVLSSGVSQGSSSLPAILARSMDWPSQVSCRTCLAASSVCQLCTHAAGACCA